jgi:hypothetical protein
VGPFALLRDRPLAGKLAAFAGAKQRFAFVRLTLL